MNMSIVREKIALRRRWQCATCWGGRWERDFLTATVALQEHLEVSPLCRDGVLYTEPPAGPPGG